MHFDIEIVAIICSILSFIPAIIFHEVAHGLVAYRLGDPTAKSEGRLSLNPLKHIDIFGTLVLPGMLMFAGLPVFGYAKPVPYNPSYFKNPRTGDLFVGLAGPAANLILACIGALCAWGIYLFMGGSIPVTILASSNEIFYYFYFYFIRYFVLINLYFMFFNLLPIPPLDGSSIFAIILPHKWLPTYYKIQQFALPVFFIIIFFVPYLTGVNVIQVYLQATAENLAYLMLAPL